MPRERRLQVSFSSLSVIEDPSQGDPGDEVLRNPQGYVSYRHPSKVLAQVHPFP